MSFRCFQWFANLLIIALLFWSCELAQATPLLTEQEKKIAIGGITEYPEVLEAAITQRGRRLSLVLIVAYGTNKSRARNLGDNFVRMVKTFAKAELSPSKQIGKGVYDYLVGVYYPNKVQVVMGAKVSIAVRITW